MLCFQEVFLKISIWLVDKAKKIVSFIAQNLISIIDLQVDSCLRLCKFQIAMTIKHF